MSAPPTPSSTSPNPDPHQQQQQQQEQQPDPPTTTSSTSPPPHPKPTERPRLSESEKKSNHIASEQKRRMAIREGFDRLTELVPGLEGMGRSESVVLQRTVEYIKMNLQEEEELRRKVVALGGTLEGEGIRH